MGTNLVIYENNQQVEISTDDIRKYIASDLNEKEFWIFIQTAKTYGLNPFKREIYAVKYGNTFSVITGYQVYLQRVEQADILDYWDCIVEKPDPKNADTWVGVFTAKRKDWIKEFTWTVPMKEVNKRQALWNLQPEFQLRKVAISQGLRMLCPSIVGGMPYISDELGIDESNEYGKKTPDEKQKEERESADNAKTAYLQTLSETIDKLTTIAKIDEFYNKNASVYKKSAFFEEIKSVYQERKRDLVNVIMAKNMNVDIQDLIAFKIAVNGDGIDNSLIEPILADNADACKELKTRIENWKKERDARIDAEAKHQ